MPKFKVFKPTEPVRLSHINAERLWVFSETRNGERIIRPLPEVMPHGNGSERLLFTGAKLYRNAKGFFVGGYAYDGSDIREALEAIGLA